MKTNGETGSGPRSPRIGRWQIASETEVSAKLTARAGTDGILAASGVSLSRTLTSCMSVSISDTKTAHNRRVVTTALGQIFRSAGAAASDEPAAARVNWEERTRDLRQIFSRSSRTPFETAHADEACGRSSLGGEVGGGRPTRCQAWRQSACDRQHGSRFRAAAPESIRRGSTASRRRSNPASIQIILEPGSPIPAEARGDAGPRVAENGARERRQLSR